MRSNLSRRIAYVPGAATTVIKAGPGYFSGVVIGKGAGGGAISIYDGISAAGTQLAELNTSATDGPNLVPFGVNFETGLTVVTSTGLRLSVIFA